MAMSRHVSIHYRASRILALALCAFSLQNACTAGIESYRSQIMDLYNATLADPNVSWLTKLYMRALPVTVAPIPAKDIGTCSGRAFIKTIELDISHLAAHPEREPMLLTHEFMHYRHAHVLLSVLVAGPVIAGITVAGMLAALYYVEPPIERLRKRLEEPQKSSNRMTRWAAKLANISLTAAKGLAVGAAGLACFVPLDRLLSRFCEFQADASSVRLTGLFEEDMVDRMRYTMNKVKVNGIGRWIYKKHMLLTYPSGIDCARNIANVAAQEKLQELLAQNPSISHDILSAQAKQWAGDLLQSAMRKAAL